MLWVLVTSVATAPPDTLIRCASAPSSAGCSFPPPPPVFDVRFDFGASGNATIRVTTAWSRPYANLFWQLASLGYYDGNPPFRVDYRNASYGFMAQMGWNLQPGVQDAWESHRAVAAAVPATQSNTRGRVAMGMGAAVCNASARVDPCEKYRPACTATDYCAYGGATQFFISFGDNSRLDAHGFAPFGEVVDGMETIEGLGQLLGNAYGEMQDLCPEVRTSTTSAFCLYGTAAPFARLGVTSAALSAPGAEKSIAAKFPLMFEARIRTAAHTVAARS